MPLYEYECRACGRRIELRQKVTDEPLSVCPTCGGACRKVFHPVGIVFKGSGWYVTDSRKGEAATTTNGASDKAGTEKAGEAPAAPKPATDGTKSDTSAPAKDSSTPAPAKSDKTPAAT